MRIKILLGLTALLQFPFPAMDQDTWSVGIGDIEAITDHSIMQTIYQRNAQKNDTISPTAAAFGTARADIDTRVSNFAQDFCASNLEYCTYLLQKYKLRWHAGSILAKANPVVPTTGPFGTPVPTAPPPATIPFGQPPALDPFGQPLSNSNLPSAPMPSPAGQPTPTPFHPPAPAPAPAPIPFGGAHKD
jgi:hypothetical protein